MTQHEQLDAAWRVWRHERLCELTHPYGWSSLSAQYWLHEGDTDITLDALPGLWSASGGTVMHTPTPQDLRHPPLTRGGAILTDLTELPPVGALIGGAPTGRIIFSGSREVEVYPRQTSQGGVVHAVRVRDPQSAASAHTLTLPAFRYDPALRVPSTFIAHTPGEVIRETVIPEVVDVVQSIGTLHFSLGGEPHSVIVFGQPSPADVQPFTQIHDATSGSLTHSNGRKIDLTFTPDGQIETIDFNTLYTLPCSLTNFVSCPIPIAENRLRVAILAGEQTPVWVRG